MHCTDVAVLKKRGRPKKSLPPTVGSPSNSTAENPLGVDIQRWRNDSGISNHDPDIFEPGQSSPHMHSDDAVTGNFWSYSQREKSSPSGVSQPANNEFDSRPQSDEHRTARVTIGNDPYPAPPPLPSERHSGWQEGRPSFIHSDCRYPFLSPALPLLAKSMSVFMACDLLDAILMDPGVSMFRAATPLIPTRVFRKLSFTSSSRPRATSPALIITMLWCAAYTADIPALQRPGARTTMINSLQSLSLSLLLSTNCGPVPGEIGESD